MKTLISGDYGSRYMGYIARYIVYYIILLQLNPTVKRHVQFVCDQAIYKADFGEKTRVCVCTWFGVLVR